MKIKGKAQRESTRGTGDSPTLGSAPPAVGTGAADELQSWKEIAGFIDRDERTAMRWAKEQGMPVHRIPGGSRGRVYASRVEISAWLAGGRHQPEREHEPIPAQRAAFPLKYLFAAAAVLCLILGIGFAVRHSRSRILPATVSFSIDSVRALGPDGQVLWTHRFPAPLDPRAASGDGLSGIADLARIADLLGNGSREVLVVAPLSSGPNPQDFPRVEVDCFSSTGVLLWSYLPHESFKFGENYLNGPWALFNIMVSSRRPRPYVYAAWNHRIWGDAFVTEIDPYSGRGTVRFVNTGTVHVLNELHTTRKTYLVAGGFNNEYDGGSVAVIDEATAFAVSPQTAGTRHKCTSCPPGDPDYYFVFPRSELNRLRGVYENPAIVAYVNGNELEIHKQEIDGRMQSLYLFLTAPTFQLLSLRFSSTYDMLHQDLEKSGQLDHALADCPERVHPQPIRVWTPSGGWKEWDVPRVQ